jgi:hypothetical protein
MQVHSGIVTSDYTSAFTCIGRDCSESAMGEVAYNFANEAFQHEHSVSNDTTSHPHM